MDLLPALIAYLDGQLDDMWVVGGAVRDRLLGRPAHDLDLVTAQAVPLARGFARAVRAAFVPLDVERGIARVVARDGASLDFCRPQGADLEADLRRRDFTLNAIACPLGEWLRDAPRWTDPLGGVADLAARRLRVASPDALTADPLRVLRAHRLAAVLGLYPEAATEALLRAAAPRLADVAAERSQVEWLAWLAAPGAAEELTRAARLGTVAALVDLPADPAAAWRRGAAALAQVAATAGLEAWAAEPVNRAVSLWGGLLPAGGDELTGRLARRFALSRRQRDLLARARLPVPAERAGLAEALEAHGLDLAARLVGAAGRGALGPAEVGAVLAQLADGLLARHLEPPLVTGADLIGTLGYTPGAALGACLRALRLAQTRGELADRTAALDAARAWWDEQ